MIALVQFLRARLDEDEQVAREAEGNRLFDGTGIAVDRDRAVDVGSHVAAFIARHDPSWVLADVEAKRRIIARLEYRVTMHDEQAQELGEWDDLTRHYFEVVRDLAAPYASHADYREEWRI